MSIVVDNTSESVEQVTENLEPVAEEIIEATSEEPVESTPTEETAAEAESISEVPEKYAGKTIEDVIKMHQLAEETIGRQGREFGERVKTLQQTIDEMYSNNSNQTTEEPTEESVSFEDSFYDNPEMAVANLINSNPDIKQAREIAKKATQDSALQQLESAYPDYKDVITDNNFLDWIGQSSVRKKLFQNAHTNWDFDSASELISTWKQISMVSKTNEIKELQKKKREEALKQAVSEKRTTGGSVGGKKVYRRADLQRMQMYEPDRYASLQDEIYKAYQEGRVK